MRFAPKFYQIAISAKDIEASIAFYGEVLGFPSDRKPRRLFGKTPSRIQGCERIDALTHTIADPNSDCQLEFFQYFEPSPSASTESDPSIGYRGFTVSVPNIDAVLARAKAVGLEVKNLGSEAAAQGGVRRALLWDPDKCAIEVLSRPFTPVDFDPALPSIEAVCLAVPDLAEAKRQFGSILGMAECEPRALVQIAEAFGGARRLLSQAAYLSNTRRVELIQFEGTAGTSLGRERNIAIPGISHIGLWLKKRSDFHTLYREALAAGLSAISKPANLLVLDVVYLVAAAGYVMEATRFSEAMRAPVGLRKRVQL